jgi:hypothetical protein
MLKLLKANLSILKIGDIQLHGNWFYNQRITGNLINFRFRVKVKIIK